MADINVNLKSFEPFNGLKRGKLHLELSGKDCNLPFVNAIGRIATKRIPVYAYTKELIQIQKINPETGFHDSVPFNYDMIRNRIKNTPVAGIDPEISYLHERYWKNANYLDKKREKHENEKEVEANINIENRTDDILHVTTNDMLIYVNDKIEELYSKEYPFLIISLKPNEAFKCSLKAVVGIGLNDTCWDSAGNYWYDENDGKIDFFIEGNLCYDEFKLISRSIEYFKLRTKLLKEEIKRQYSLDKEKKENFQVKIVDEDHTFGQIINYEIQSHKNIKKSSMSKPSLLVREIILDIIVSPDNVKSMIDFVMEAFDNLMNKIDVFEREYNKLLNSDKQKLKPKTKKN